MELSKKRKEEKRKEHYKALVSRRAIPRQKEIVTETELIERKTNYNFKWVNKSKKENFRKG